MTLTTERAAGNVRKQREILASLITKRGEFDVATTTLAAERSSIAFAAHTGDKAAKKRLNEIHVEAAKQASEVASLDAAIEEANHRVADALVDLARAEDAIKARRALDLLDTFRHHGDRLDAACKALIAGYSDFVECHRELLALGVRNPSPEMTANGCRRAVISTLQETELALHRSATAFLAPGERHTFVELVDGWAGGVETWAAMRLDPEASTEEAK